MLNVLIVEDEINLGKSLLDYLKIKGHNPVWSSTYTESLELEKSQKFDVVLMDIGLPDGNGVDLAKIFMKQTPKPTLLFLSALNDPQTKLEGLEIGADDYITKPFNLKELSLRLDRILKTKPTNPKTFKIGKINFDTSKFEIEIDGKKTTLATKENKILELLLTKKDSVVSREEIIESIWGNNQFPSNRTVDNYIVNLRKILEVENKITIQSIRGIGYSLKIKENI
jgi:two-component system alkaline phosphatase synthesis response regulator PhoP